MAELFVKQAAIYAEARPSYPKEWFDKLASLTTHHKLAWDAGAGNGQAAVCVAEHYEKVIATDVSEAQIKHAIPHPNVRYVHTPLSTSEQDFVSMLGGEGSVDLVTVAMAVHWFDLPRFYSIVNRVLRKPGGVIAVWGYNYDVSPLEEVLKRFYVSTLPYRDERGRHVLEGYRTLPFPFESIGLGTEGNPKSVDMDVEVSFESFVESLRTVSAVTTAKERGVDLLSEEVVKELRTAWGGYDVRKITYKAFMLAGKLNLEH